MSRIPSGLAGLALACAALATAAAHAEPTQLEVRVLSKGAKFVGTSMGGVEITVRDADSGELLAQGVTAGGTGDTGRIMKTPAKRHDPVSTPDAAVFRTTLELERPRRIEISALGPLAQRQSASRVSSTMWMVPGKHVRGGDGWLLELPGFAVDVLAPPAHVRIGSAPQKVEVRANVVMMCGCPIEPGGLWDANRFEVRAVVLRDGQKQGEVPMRYAGSTSQFAAEIDASAPGAFEVLVYAHDPENGNTGLDRTTFLVEAAR
jgi:hypothetical protein